MSICDTVANETFAKFGHVRALLQSRHSIRLQLLTMPPFSQSIGRHKTCHSIILHFPTANDCFRGSDQGVPMAEMLWLADAQMFCQFNYCRLKVLFKENGNLANL